MAKNKQKGANMQINAQSIGYNALVGTAVGAAIGAGVGTFNGPFVCGVVAVRTVFLHQFWNGHSLSNLDAGVAAFQNCAIQFPAACTAAFAIGGLAIGLIYGICQTQREPSTVLPMKDLTIGDNKTNLHIPVPNDPTEMPLETAPGFVHEITNH